MAKVNRKNMTEKQLKNLKQNKNGIKPPLETYTPRKVPKVRPVDPDEKETPEQKKKRDWEFNHVQLTKAYFDIMLSKQRRPMNSELCLATNLSPSTVDRHLADFNFEEVTLPFKLGVESVMLNLYRQAVSGKSEKIIRLFLDAVGVTDKKKLDITSGGKPLPAPPPPMAGVVTLNPKDLPTEFLQKLIAQHESNNS